MEEVLPRGSKQKKKSYTLLNRNTLFARREGKLQTPQINGDLLTYGNFPLDTTNLIDEQMILTPEVKGDTNNFLTEIIPFEYSGVEEDLYYLPPLLQKVIKSPFQEHKDPRGPLPLHSAQQTDIFACGVTILELFLSTQSLHLSTQLTKCRELENYRAIADQFKGESPHLEGIINLAIRMILQKETNFESAFNEIIELYPEIHENSRDYLIDFEQADAGQGDPIDMDLFQTLSFKEAQEIHDMFVMS